jgi:hypothetical protein
MSMKEVNVKLWDSYLHKTESTAYPYHQKDSRNKEDGPTRLHLNDSLLLNDSGHASINKSDVDLRPTDVIKCGTTGIDSSYFW